MSESGSHKEAKRKAAGKRGRTEVPLRGRRQLDALGSGVATEVERSPDPNRIAQAVRWLIAVRARRKRLIVPQRHLDEAMGVTQRVVARE